MSLEVLRADKTVCQSPKHDLKSFFYILLFICMKFKGPGTKRASKDLRNYTSFGIDDWFSFDCSFKDITNSKAAQLMCFEDVFISKFDPYLHDLKDCLWSLYGVIFDGGKGLWANTAEYNVMLETLQKTYDYLPDIDDAVTGALSQAEASSNKEVSSHRHRMSKSGHHFDTPVSAHRLLPSWNSLGREQWSDDKNAELMLDSGFGSVYSPSLSWNPLGGVKWWSDDKITNQTVDSEFGSACSLVLSQSSLGRVKWQADENILLVVDSGLGSSIKKRQNFYWKCSLNVTAVVLNA